MNDVLSGEVFLHRIVHFNSFIHVKKLYAKKYVDTYPLLEKKKFDASTCLSKYLPCITLCDFRKEVG